MAVFNLTRAIPHRLLPVLLARQTLIRLSPGSGRASTLPPQFRCQPCDDRPATVALVESPAGDACGGAAIERDRRHSGWRAARGWGLEQFLAHGVIGCRVGRL